MRSKVQVFLVANIVLNMSYFFSGKVLWMLLEFPTHSHSVTLITVDKMHTRPHTIAHFARR